MTGIFLLKYEEILNLNVLFHTAKQSKIQSCFLLSAVKESTMST